MKNVTIYFDMDGVLCKWNEKATLEEVSSPGYFLKREIETTVKKLIFYLKESGYQVRILTSVYQNGYAEDEKKQWLKNNGLKEIPVTFVPYGDSKFKYVEMGSNLCILVDDFKKNLDEWVKNGGYAVKFYNGINDRPRMIFDSEGTGHLIQDSWVGPNIDHRQTYKYMAAVILGMIEVFG